MYICEWQLYGLFKVNIWIVWPINSMQWRHSCSSQGNVQCDSCLPIEATYTAGKTVRARFIYYYYYYLLVQDIDIQNHR